MDRDASWAGQQRWRLGFHVMRCVCVPPRPRFAAHVRYALLCVCGGTVACAVLQTVKEWSDRLGSPNSTLPGGWIMTDQLVRPQDPPPTGRRWAASGGWRRQGGGGGLAGEDGGGEGAGVGRKLAGQLPTGVSLARQYLGPRAGQVLG